MGKVPVVPFLEKIVQVTKTHLTHPKYRPDIDGLRAVAILSVVLFHAFPNIIKGGFIGVDIFFVISGYLISTIIFENLRANTFSFVEFYRRRIKRIFPALIIVLVACYLFGWFMLTPKEFDQMSQHIVGGVGFVSNFILWKESGYFDNAAVTKPLLHLWTLGIEEQYYIVWPILMWLAWRWALNLLGVAVIALTASFVVNIATISNYPVAAFYSPLSRFWELLIGSLIAYLAINNRGLALSKTTRHSNLLSGIGILLICIAILLLDKQAAFPGWWALLPTVGTTMIIIAGSNAWLNRWVLSNKVIVGLGLISYPLYLWHWPLLSLMHIVRSDELSIDSRAAIVLASVVLAWLTYRLVEKPIRSASVKMTVTLISLMLGIGLIAYYTKEHNGIEARFSIPPLHINAGEYDCHNQTSGEPCIFGNLTSNKIIVVYGDSHAGQLTNALNAAVGSKFKIYFFGQNCFLGPGSSDGSECTLRKEEMAKLASKEIYAVIRSQRWISYTQATKESIEKSINVAAKPFGLNPEKIIIAGSTEEINSSCEFANYYLASRRRTCEVNQISREYNELFDKTTKNLSMPKNVFFVYPYEKICLNNICSPIKGSISYYIDNHHLTEDGAMLVMPDIVRILNN